MSEPSFTPDWEASKKLARTYSSWQEMMAEQPAINARLTKIAKDDGVIPNDDGAMGECPKPTTLPETYE